MKEVLKDFLTDKNQLRTDDPYSEIIEIFKQKHYSNDFVAPVHTSVLGFDTVYCEYDGDKDCYIWKSDWYEGGECHLIAFCPIEDITFTYRQVWEGYHE